VGATRSTHDKASKRACSIVSSTMVVVPRSRESYRAAATTTIAGIDPRQRTLEGCFPGAINLALGAAVRRINTPSPASPSPRRSLPFDRLRRSMVRDETSIGWVGAGHLPYQAVAFAQSETSGVLLVDHGEDAGVPRWHSR
jgi:hypothetical protein